MPRSPIFPAFTAGFLIPVESAMAAYYFLDEVACSFMSNLHPWVICTRLVAGIPFGAQAPKGYKLLGLAV